MKKSTAFFVICVFTAVPASCTRGAFSYRITEFGQYNGVNGFADFFSDGLEPPSTPYPSPEVEYNVRGAFRSDRENGGMLELNSQDAEVFGDMVRIAVGLDSPAHFFSPGSTGYVLGVFNFAGGFPPESCFGIHLGLTGTVNSYILVYTNTENSQYAVWGSSSTLDDFDDLCSGLGRIDITADLAGRSAITLRLNLNAADQVTALFDYGSDGSYDLTIPDFAIVDLDPIVVSPTNTRHSSGAFFAASTPDVIPTPNAILLAGLGAGLVRSLRRHRIV